MSIVLDRVNKIFPNGRVAVRDLDLEVGDGELLALVGPSGCGKSTVLRLIAGLEAPTSGRVIIDGRDVTGVPANERDLAMVFQSYALYPHMTVADNLAFGLRMRGVDRSAIDVRVRSVAETLQIEPLLRLKPSQLSGGQRQRVALGRAMVREPRAFLLDEPLSNLDPQLRVDTRTELGQLHRRLHATMIHVTHDQEEAMTLGDRIAVMRDGAAVQIAPPLELYQRPLNPFVATFVGSPKMNVFDVTVTAGDGGRLLLAGPGFSVDGPQAGITHGMPLLLGIRPRDILMSTRGREDLAAQVTLVELLGHEAIIHTRVDAGADVTLVANADEISAATAVVYLRFPRERLHLFRKNDGSRLA